MTIGAIVIKSLMHHFDERVISRVFFKANRRPNRTSPWDERFINSKVFGARGFGDEMSGNGVIMNTI